MKKLIAISVMLALVTGAVFAQMSFGGHFGIKSTIIGDTAGEGDIVAGINMQAARMNVDFANESGTAGGRVRLYANQPSGPTAPWWGQLPFAYAWFKPAPNIRIQVGHNPDGDLGAAQLTGWGMIQEAQDYVAVDQDAGDGMGSYWQRGRRSGFYPGFSAAGFIVQFMNLFEGFTLNVVLPMSSGAGRDQGNIDIAKVYTNFHLNAVYAVPDIGVARLSFQGLGGLDPDTAKSPGDIFASFFLNQAIENNSFDIGIRYGIPWENGENAKGETIMVYPGMDVGLGYNIQAGKFAFRARIGTFFGATNTSGGFEPTTIGLVVKPMYSEGNWVFHFNAGFGIRLPASDNEAHGITEFDFYINPYCTRSFGNLTFYGGIKLGSPNLQADEPTIKWAIPIGFGCHF
ncbi:MAG: hypothetical protein FWB86_12610 [Treponema sp.]|nr:hypothetical protein [Treponema sp.]